MLCRPGEQRAGSGGSLRRSPAPPRQEPKHGRGGAPDADAEAECYTRCYGKRDERVSILRDPSESTLPAARFEQSLRELVEERLAEPRRPSRRPHEARLPQLDVAPPLRAAPEGPAAGAAAERLGLHGDVDGASATLQAAWPPPHLTSPTSSPRACAASSAASTRAASRPRRPRTSRTRATTSGGCSTTAASRRGCTTRRSSSRCSSSATASRTPRTGRRPARATCGAATSTPRGSRRSPASCARARSRSSARRPTAARSASGRSSGRSFAPSARRGLFVLPSTSPANAAVPYAERLRWFRALHDWLDAPERRAVRALVLDPAERLLLVKFVHPVTGEHWWATPGGGVIEGESDEAALRRELLEEAGLAAFELGPLVWTRTNDFAWLGRLLHQLESIYLVRAGEHEPAPTIDLVPEGVAEVRWWTLDELDAAHASGTAVFAPATRLCRACGSSSATAHRPSRSTSASSLSSRARGLRHRPPARRDGVGRRLGRARLRGRAGDPRARGRAARQGDEGARPALAPARLRRAHGRRARRASSSPATTGTAAARRSRRCCGSRSPSRSV